MLKIKRKGDFDKMMGELLVNDADLESVLNESIKLFQSKPNDTRLDNHALTKKMEGKWAFSITDDIRIVYEWLGKTTVRFLAIGGHKKVYKRRTKTPTLQLL